MYSMESGSMIGRNDLVSISALLSLYVVDNKSGVPDYDRKMAKRMIKIVRAEKRMVE